MPASKTDRLPRQHIVTLAAVAAALWVAIVLISALWNIHLQHESVIALAHMPDRDLNDQFGRELTLVNPATVIREVGERFTDLYGVKTRITGRVYLNPVNKPDAWELSAIDGKPYLRLMWPMWMEVDCMRCHAHMATNVSAHQLRKPELPDQIESLIAEFGLDASRMELEVTESLAMAQGDTALLRLDQLRRLGLGIAIDDFGTGFSSLSRLKRLPVTVLKIDRSFVHDIAEDHEDRAIAKAVVTLARTMHLDVVAEGVETEAQAAILRDMDCDMVQGYLFARPLAPQALAELLQAQNHGI